MTAKMGPCNHWLGQDYDYSDTIDVYAKQVENGATEPSFRFSYCPNCGEHLHDEVLIDTPPPRPAPTSSTPPPVLHWNCRSMIAQLKEYGKKKP